MPSAPLHRPEFLRRLARARTAGLPVAVVVGTSCPHCGASATAARAGACELEERVCRACGQRFCIVEASLDDLRWARLRADTVRWARRTLGDLRARLLLGAANKRLALGVDVEDELLVAVEELAGADHDEAEAVGIPWD